MGLATDGAVLEGLLEVLWRLRLPHSGSVGSMTAPASMWSDASDSVIVVSPLEPPSIERANAAAEVLGTLCGKGSCTVDGPSRGRLLLGWPRAG